MRKSAHTDFSVPVDGVGTFVYGRRTLGDSMKIRARFLELVGANADDIELAATASAVATHEVLCVSAPKGWEDLLQLDGIDNDNAAKVFDLFAKVGEQEDSFRGAQKVHRAPTGPGAIEDAGLLVQA